METPLPMAVIPASWNSGSRFIGHPDWTECWRNCERIPSPYPLATCITSGRTSELGSWNINWHSPTVAWANWQTEIGCIGFFTWVLRSQTSVHR
jgi:hypothetical protein